MIVDYIDDHRDRFGVDPICTVLTSYGVKIAPSTYYAAKVRGPVSDAAWTEAHAANTVHRLFVSNRRLYGVRKMWHAMKHAGHDVGRDEVSRLMGICGISGAVRGRRRTMVGVEDGALRGNLVGRFERSARGGQAQSAGGRRVLAFARVGTSMMRPVRAASASTCKPANRVSRTLLSTAFLYARSSRDGMTLVLESAQRWSSDIADRFFVVRRRSDAVTRS